MSVVQLLATGGTIASRVAGSGAVASDPSGDLLARVDPPPGIEVRARDVLRVNSYAMRPDDVQSVIEAVYESLAAPAVDGVVVTHGTDSMEETAFAVDLFHDDPRPVVFTGAQRSADHPFTDGPANLRDAMIVAGTPQARGLGVLVVFGGSVYAAAGTRKVHTLALAPFASPDSGPLGGLRDGMLWLARHPVRRKPLQRPLTRLSDTRVDVVALYPGCDTSALDAVVAAGARGVVIEALGAGNANPAIRDAIARLVSEGVVVVLSTRVHAGPVTPLYGGGGGRDLVDVGAIPSGLLRPSQARMLLLVLLAAHADSSTIRSAFSSEAP